jgi:hypothetical protein
MKKKLSIKSSTDPLIDEVIKNLRRKGVPCGTGAEIVKVRKGK